MSLGASLGVSFDDAAGLVDGALDEGGKNPDGDSNRLLLDDSLGLLLGLVVRPLVKEKEGEAFCDTVGDTMGDPVGDVVGVTVELTHLQSGSISVQAQFFDSIVVCPFKVIDLEYEH